MAISDRIAVMNAGVIQQVGTPKELYLRPQNTFVANFVGTSNFIKGTVYNEGGALGVRFPDGHKIAMSNLANVENGTEVIIAVRPEEFVLTDEGIEAIVEDSSFLGLNTHIFATLATGERVAIIQESTMEANHRRGDSIRLGVKAEKINIFAADGSSSLIV